MLKSWKEFTEEHAKKEERSGLDLDGDKERGEPKAQKKVKEKHKEMLEFFTARRAGAKKIASDALAKAGPATLTAWHFKAKDSQYIELINALKTNKNEAFFREKYIGLIQKINRKGMKQQDFQELMGKIET